jgi:hypothetical protein
MALFNPLFYAQFPESKRSYELKSSLDLSKEPLSGGESGIRTHDGFAFDEDVNFHPIF